MRRTSGLLIASLVLLISACRQRAAATAKAEPLLEVFRQRARAEGLTRVQTGGKRLFARYCTTCHGEAGQGDGQNAYNLDPPPPDFRESLKAHPPSYWRQIVEGGSAAVGRSPLCPPWGHSLESGEIDALIAYLQALAHPPTAPPPKAEEEEGR